MASELKIGTLVFAKMKNFPYWPGIISEPQDEIVKNAPGASKPGTHCIFFFGSRNYCWLDKDKIELYSESKDKFLPKSPKTTAFRKAYEEIEDFIKRGQSVSSLTENDPFDVLKSMPAKSSKSIKRKSDDPASLSGSSDTPKRKDKKSDPKLDKKMDVDDSLSKYTFSSIKKMRPESPGLVLEDFDVSEDVETSSLNFGFLGLGRLGMALVKNLLKTQHKVTVWNRSAGKQDEAIGAGATKGASPADVVAINDVTFCCVSDDAALKEIVFGTNGVLSEMKAGKSFVEMSACSADLSQKVADAVSAAGGRYLEVRFLGGFSCHAPESNLILMAAGERSLYDDCLSCFSTFSKQSIFLSEVGKASSLYLFAQTQIGILFCALSESLKAADILGIERESFLKVLVETELINPFIQEKCLKPLLNKDQCDVSVKNMKKDMLMFLKIGNKLNMPSIIITYAYELLKNQTRSEELDISSILVD